jgi:4-hydroxymandelate oxidase
MDRWLDGLENAARQALSEPLFRYLSQGAREGVTAGEATAAWRRHRLRPHVLRDVTDVDLSTTLLGAGLATPVGVAPTTLQRAVNPEGELAMARAAADAGSLMVVSSNAGTPFTEIGETGVTWWLQAYLPSDRTLIEPLLKRAVEAGAQAVVLTADTPVVGTKYDGAGPTVWEEIDTELLRVNFDDGYETAPGSEKATDLGPHDIGWVGETTGLPVVVKGVLRADDASRCTQAGAQAIWVSNHGGRQLDRAVQTATALPDIVAAVSGDVEVYVDGGLRSGLDILTALALGARGVFLGRLPIYALAGGEDAVRRMHAEIRRELVESLRLSGCRTPADTEGLVSPGLPL